MRFSPAAAAALATLAAATLLTAHRGGWLTVPLLDNVELLTLDLRFGVRGPRPAGDEVVIVAVDDRTLEEAPDLFERRAGQARLIRAIRAAGATTIGIDLLFAEPERILPDADRDAVRAWLADPEPAPRAEDVLRAVDANTRGDETLAAALKEGGDVVLAVHVGSQGNLDADDRSLSKGRFGQVTAGDQLPATGTRVLASEPMFNRAAAALGLMTSIEDASGRVREIPLGLRLGPQVFAPLAVQLVAHHEGVNRGKVAFLGEQGAVRIGDRELRGDHGRLRLNWRGPDAFRTLSAVDVVGAEPPDLAGRIALVGYTHLAQDAVTTPFGRRPGVEVHATAVDNVLRGDSLRRASPWADGLLALVAGLAVAGLFLLRFLGAMARVALSAVPVLAAAALGQAALSATDLWIAAVGPVAVGAVALATAVAVSWLQEGRQRRFLRRAFAHYLSPALVAELVRDPSQASLRGERRQITALFSDIRDFTTFAERLEPLELQAFLNDYFGPMTGAVLDNAGYVDKFIGDAVMALFGAPLPRPDHPREALRAALAMHRALEALRPRARELGIDLQIGIGVNTGDAVVGNLGSAERFDYTVLGDAVNLASRIEGLTKQYGVLCLVGEATARAAPDVAFRSVDLVRVKGKGEPTELFELLGDGAHRIARYEAPEAWDRAIAAWRAGDLPAAREAFEVFRHHNPDDPVVALYLGRLDDLGDAAPPGWDGVFVHEHK